MQRDQAIRGILAEINLEVAALPAPHVRALIPGLVHAERELADDLAELVGRMGVTSYNAQSLRRALLQVRGALNAIDKLRPEMLNELVKAGQQAGQLVTKHLERELAKFSTLFEGTITPVPLVPASKIANSMLLDRFAASTKRWSKVARNHIRHELTVGMLRNETAAQMAARLTGKGAKFARALAEQSEKKQAEALASGMMRMTKFDANRIVRTEVVNAYNEHARDQIEQLHADERDIKMRWCAEIDGRTCIMCHELDGTVADAHGEFPGGFRQPPAHPQCRCCVTAWREDWPEPQ